MIAAAPAAAWAELVYGLTNDNRLLVFPSTRPDTILREIAITGLQAGETMRAIDFRPLDAQLYGYGSSHRLYRIHLVSGAATAINMTPFPIGVPINEGLGFDFNPQTDEIRVISGTAINFRITAATGAVVDGDPVTPGVQGDSPLSPGSGYVAAAHTSNYAGATSTTLFAISSASDHLVRIGGVGGTPSPNLGAVTDIGPLNVSANAGAALDAPLYRGDELFAHLSGGGFHLIDRATGAASLEGPVGDGSDTIHDIAVFSVSSIAYALTSHNELGTFKTHDPSTPLNHVDITGLLEQTDGELIVAIDTRPSTGQLYGLSDRGYVYVLDPFSGAAVAVRDVSIGTVGKESVGLDFDPTTDQLRIVTGSQINLRVHPDTLALTVNPDLATRDVAAIAHTQHLAGPGLSTLYGIATGGLISQIVMIGGEGGSPSPDGGTVNLGDRLPDPIPHGLVGFDLAVTDDAAFIAAEVGGADGLAFLDPFSSRVAPIGVIDVPRGQVSGLAIGTPGRVQFAGASVVTTEGAGAAGITVNRSGGDGPFSVDYQVTGGTATSGVDYTPISGTLIFLDGEMTKPLLLPIATDTLPEPFETITLTLSNPTHGAQLGSPIAFTVTIADDDSPPNTVPEIQILTPTEDPVFTANGTLITLGGTASDAEGLQSIIWSNDRGGSGTAQGTSSWLAADIPLKTGVNLITVTAIDTAGAQTTDEIAVTLVDVSYFLAEGATGAFFDLDILLANPHTTPAPVTLTFLKEGGSTVTHNLTLPATSRLTVKVDEIAGLESTAVSTIVTSPSGLPLVVERTMRWDASGYGAHTDKAADAPAPTWYFAEGSQGFFSTYLLLVNPQTTPNEVKVEYLREGTSPLTRTYTVAPRARLTVDAGADPELVDRSFGMTVTFAAPGVAERAMYFGGDPIWKAGHESAGVTTPAREWFLAEGATGPFFETFVLLSNPQSAPANVTLRYLRAGAPPIVTTKIVGALGRLTVNVEQEGPELASAAFGTEIVSSQPIVVERAQYWPFTPDQWYEAHNSFGSLTAAAKWGLAEGRVGGPSNYQTYILLANPGAADAEVTLTFLRTNGTTVKKNVTVPAASRFNVAPGPGGLVPELTNEEFATVISSTRPIVVERAMYLDAGGVTWSAGTNATATRLP